MQNVLDTIKAAFEKLVEIIEEFLAKFNFKPNHERPEWTETYPYENTTAGEKE